MRNDLIVFAIVLLCTSCSSDEDRKVDIEKLRFRTTDASELFFKNIRKSAYQVEDLAEATMEVYRYETPENGKQLVFPLLVLNWANDQAFLMLEKSKALPDEVTFLLQTDQQTDTLLFEGSHHSQHAEVAVGIYNALLDQKEIMLIDHGKAVTVFTDDERRMFKRVVSDFLRLVELK